MGENKRYYWLKLKEDFFTQPRIKKLRRIAGGDTYTLIYLKLQLLSIKNSGTLIFEGIEDDFIEELALTIDEEVDNVKFTVMYLINQGLMEEVEKDEYALVEARQNIGSETASTIRSRRSREQQKALQCNTVATICNTEIDIEKEIEIDKELDKEINKESCTNVQQKKPKKPKPVKHKRGEYEHVLLTDDEYNKLCVEYGHDKTNEAIKFLDEYIEEKGYTSKSHYLAIKRWVFNAVEKKNNNGKQAKQKEELVF